VGQIFSGPKKVTDIIKTIVNGVVEKCFRVNQSRQPILNPFIDVLVSSLVEMSFIKMEKPPHHLKKMEHNREIAAKLFEFPVTEQVAPMDDIGIKGRLKVVNEHLKLPDFNLIDFIRNNFHYLLRYLKIRWQF